MSAENISPEQARLAALEARIDSLESESAALKELTLTELAKTRSAYPVESSGPAVDFASIYSRTPRTRATPSKDEPHPGMSSIYEHPRKSG